MKTASLSCECSGCLIEYRPFYCYLPFAYVSLAGLSFFPLQRSFLGQKPRDSSVEVRSDWEVKEEMDFPQLMKMVLGSVRAPGHVGGIFSYPPIMPLMCLNQLVMTWPEP